MEQLRAETLKGICVYCGHVEQYESLEHKASEVGNALRGAHIRNCEARPELKLITFSEQLIDEVGRLRDENQRYAKVLSDRLREMEALGSSFDNLYAEAGRLREALEPFANLITAMEMAKARPRDELLSLCEVQNDGSFWSHGFVNLNDLRAARAALSGKKRV